MSKKNINKKQKVEYGVDRNGNIRLTEYGKSLRSRTMLLTPEEEQAIFKMRDERWKKVVPTPTSSDKSVERQTTTEGYNPSTATFASASNLHHKADKLMSLAFLFKILRSSKLNLDGETIKIELNVTSFEDLIREVIKQGNL